MIACVHQNGSVSFQPEPKGESRMIHVLCSDRDVAKLKVTFDQFVIADLGAHLIQPHRKIRIPHLPGERILQGLSEPFGRVDVPFVARNEERSKKGNTLNMIPMGMTDQNMATHSSLTGAHQSLPQVVKAGSTVDNHQCIGGSSHLDT